MLLLNFSKSYNIMNEIEKEKQLFIIQKMNEHYRENTKFSGKRRYDLLNPAYTKKSKYNFNIGILHYDNPKLYRKIYNKLYIEMKKKNIF